MLIQNMLQGNQRCSRCWSKRCWGKKRNL